MILRALPYLVIALLAASCGEEKDPTELVDNARTALSQGEWANAAQSSDEALALLSDSTESSLRLEAQMYFIESSAHVTPKLAKKRLVTMLEGSKLSFKDFEYLTKKLVEAEAFSQATEVVNAAEDLETFSPDDLEVLGNWVADKLQASAAATGNKDAMDALKGFGYTGNDEAPVKKVKSL